MVGDRISKRNFDRLRKFIYDYSGIKMPPTKLTMLEGRLRRRLRATGKSSSTIIAISCSRRTGSSRTGLPDRRGDDQQDRFLPRSQAFRPSCSRWRCPLSWERRAQRSGPGARPARPAPSPIRWRWCWRNSPPNRNAISTTAILATDLSDRRAATARRGIYAEMIDIRCRAICAQICDGSKKADRREVRITPALRSQGRFRPDEPDGRELSGRRSHAHDLLPQRADLFRQADPGGVLKRLCDCLLPGGYMFIGHSESITGIDLPLKQVSNTVFQRI
jgi:chemotaxis protein methyltransferase CheR